MPGLHTIFENILDFRSFKSVSPGKAADLVLIDLPQIEALEKNPKLCFRMREKILATMTDRIVRYQNPGFQF